MIFPVLRHRLLLSYHAQAEGIHPNQVITRLLSLVGSA
jgi:MoxR-like ATPase